MMYMCGWLVFLSLGMFLKIIFRFIFVFFVGLVVRYFWLELYYYIFFFFGFYIVLEGDL